MHDSETTAATGEIQPVAPAEAVVVVRHESEGHRRGGVHGELDLVSAPQLTAQLDEAMRNDARHIAIDLTVEEYRRWRSQS
jgi:hypothetical protein